ncbi:armadillo repeat-containing protein 3 [Lampris incognitus]|uniref:armadillo repeat-containing protein 3 n=1 Tax=Lampris incognitus TaxID=2546036 RepID=UPI0024B4C77A|nr:armadillo repeat-containing protein 3 [Lampris incognitus]
MGKKVKKGNEAPCKDTFESLLIKSKTPATSVLMLKSPEEEVLVKACEAIYKFAEKGDENRVSLLELGALEPLCQLITHNDKLVRRNAFMALGIMATNGDVKSMLKTLHVIPALIDKLPLEEDTVVHEFATLCLASLSVDFDCKVQIFDSKALPPLIQLLSNPDPDVKKNTLETIFNMVQDHPSRQAVHQLGGLAPLLELLKSDFPIIQQLALKTLEILTIDNDTHAAFRDQKGFDRLMDFLNNKEFNDLHVEALQVVANCMKDRESLRLIHQVGGLTRLMQFIFSPTMPEIQSNAVECIARVAQDSVNRKLLHEQDVEKALVELLFVESDSVKTAACHAVAAMSLHLASQDSFRDLDGIHAVVPLLRCESPKLKEAAAQALSHLTHNNQLNAAAVYEAKGDQALVQELHVSCTSTVAHAAATLANMAEQELLRCSILSHGAVQALVEPLQSTDTNTLFQATRCLAVLTCDTEARTKLRNAGCLQPLVNLLHYSHQEVRRNACWAISVCANDEPTAVEMCRLGALELLQQINQSVNRRNKFSELAMDKLLDSNLPIKYSLMDRLNSTDITTDGFYDAGQVRVGQKFLTLEELSKQPVDQRRPIIVVNIAVDRGQMQDDGQKEDDEVTKQHESSSEKPWTMTYDTSFQVLVTKATQSILPLNDDSEQYAALARLVSEAMGGVVEEEGLYEFQWELHLSQLKFELCSNLVPIGRIRKGFHCHRAVLFKCLADRIGVSCTLVRGEYNRAWNVVLVSRGTPSIGCLPQLCPYIVDLMHQPGRLLKANTPAAIQYQSI